MAETPQDPARKKRGRPVGSVALTAKLEDDIVLLYKGGLSDETVAETLGISRVCPHFG